ncbi:MAG: S-layer homology domain-containing protein [Clostridia bacterium]|nr:S-layer homology domain-containing protein [Clostridia bacterium]
MKLKKMFFLLVTSFALLGSNLALAVSVNSGETSSTSGEITSGENTNPSPDDTTISSGDVSGEGSGDISLEDPDEYEEVLESVALDLDFQTRKNTELKSTLSASISGDETFIYEIVTLPSNGTLTLTNSSSGDFSYMPSGDYVGADLFTYRLASGDVYSNIGTVSITVTSPSEPIIPFYYEDMQEHWANYSASHLAARGYIIGENINDEYFYFPDREMTRGDFLLFILSLVEPTSAVQIDDVKFADDDLYPTWLLEKAKTAYAMGIIKGSGSEGLTYLNAYHKITRAEAFIMISNLLISDNLIVNAADDIDYADKNTIPSWALQSIKNLSAYKIVQGDSNKNINPLDTINRGEAAELIFKVLKEMDLLKLESIPSGDAK